jgi:centromere/kinetochore protein ZW10
VEHLKDISALLESAQDAAAHGHIIHALNRIEETQAALKQLGPFENTRVVGVLRSKLDQVRAAIGESVFESWNALIVVDTAEHRVTVRKETQSMPAQ